ncbi:sodium/potassium-transporting ATPase subunit beta-2-like [Bombyx mandarina]|uniref:Uncharacterized protein n=2 Tax=Bombyx TaxID=7090 RepID=A0A8R2G8Z4_BOMMO|nr:sodium/potassium-transporting ATPase subunit beta-2 [Bombyx mori]XP_028025536.1 sodium/potassium-transporting ATPase subunit beta-2-like [Bombyx mandarina]
MGMEKRTVKIIIAVAVTVIVIATILGLLLGLLLPQRYVELEVWPRSEEFNYYQPMIHFTPSDAGSWHPWYRRISEFLKVYETSVPDNPPRAPCTIHNQRDMIIRSDSCSVAMKVWAPCTADHFYGYPDGRPCVFLRLSHVHYWVPHPYNITSPLPIPQEMPQNLQFMMRQFPADKYGDTIWVSCEGEFTADKENIGPVHIVPMLLPPGFPTHRLHTADKIPYATRNLPDPVPGPLVAVYFENPRRGVVVNVECRIWSRDIIYSPSSRVGRARFELLVQ